MLDLPTPGRPWEATGSPRDRRTSGGGRLQLEKSGGVRPSRGTTYPGIPTSVVLGVVMPPEEAATPLQTPFLHKLLFAGFLVPSCPKRALVWGTVVRGFARQDLC